MNEARSHRASLVTAIFAQAHDLPADQRRQFVRERCAGDAELGNVVEYLLDAYDRGMADHSMDRPLNPPADPDAASTVSAGPDGPAPGAAPPGRIGRYKLLQPIGEGGFGTVHMAEQEHPIRRRVALKIIKAGMDTKQVIARFESERQALAMMDHPNIAKVLDAGATGTGRPYFVMELVKGVSVTEYCDKEKLATRQRLELFVPVCQAVQHAHQKGVIHRDLKPSNILITLHDGKPVPKVIDFGIAKATQSRLTEKTLFTELKQFVGTPEYMSPEQAEMSGLDIDTRSDIYSLGVLLYELLTGTTPFDAKTLRSKGYAEIQRVIREVEPPKPSTRVASLGEKLMSVASSRRTDPRKLGQLIHGELDWIVMKCLEKDRTRRYETANGLAMDVQRYLRNELVLASPPSAGYRLRKFAQRNRHVLGTGVVVAAMFLVAVAAVVRYAFQQRRLAREQHVLNIERGDFVREQEKAISSLHAEQRKTNTELYHTLLRHSEAVRLARCPGYRAIVWTNLHQANRLNTPEHDPEEIKKEVLACLDDPVGLDTLNPSSASVKALRGVLRRSKNRSTVKQGDSEAVVSGGQIQLRGKGDVPLGSVPIPLGNVVNDLQFSPDGRLLAVACDQGVAVLDIPRLTQHTFYRGQWASSVAFDPTGSLLASTGDNITLWSMRSNRPVASLPQPDADPSELRVAFSPDGQLLAALKGDAVLSAWPVGSTPEVVRLAGHFGGVPTVAYSRDGQFIASVGKDLLVKVWDGRTGALLHSNKGHTVSIQTAAFHPDSTLLATGDDDGHVILWDLKTHREVARIDATSLKKPWRMHFDTSGRYLIVGGLDGIGAWEIDRRDGEGVSAEQFFTMTTPHRVADVAIHPDGTRFVFTHAGQLCAYDLRTARLRDVAGAEAWGYFNSLHFSPSGGLLRFTSESGRLGEVDWTDGAAARVTDTVVKFLSQSGDGRWVATFAPADGIVIYDAETRQRWCTLPGGGVEVWSLAWSPDGTRLAVSHADGAMSLWDLKQVGARLAEFGINLPPTAVSERTNPPPGPLSESAFEQIVDFHKGRAHRWTYPTRLETTTRYTGPDRFPAPAEEWTGWRGPRGDLVSRETSLAADWPEGGPSLLWRASVGLGYASPVASRGRVYVFSLHQSQDTLTAFDALTGQILWSESDDNGWTGDYPGTRATPTVDGDAVYTYGGEGSLVRRDAATGRRAWRLDVLGQVGATNLKWGTTSSPLVVGARVFVQCGKGGPIAVAVDKESGRIEWTSEARGDCGYAQPILADVSGTQQLIVVGENAVYAMDPGGGKTIWSEPWESKGEAHASAPIYSDGRLLVADGYGAMMLKVSPAGAAQLWASEDIASSFHGPVFDRGLVFANANGVLKCIAWPEATIKWSAREPASPGGGGSFVRAGDRLVMIGHRGGLRLVRAAGAGGEVISQVNLPATKDPKFVWPAPLIYGGRLYVKGEQELWCYDAASVTPAAPAVARTTQPAGG